MPTRMHDAIGRNMTQKRLPCVLVGQATQTGLSPGKRENFTAARLVDMTNFLSRCFSYCFASPADLEMNHFFSAKPGMRASIRISFVVV